MTPFLVAEALAILDVGAVAAFAVQGLRLRRKRRDLMPVSRPEQQLYHLLAVIAASAVLALLVGFSATGVTPY